MIKDILKKIIDIFIVLIVTVCVIIFSIILWILGLIDRWVSPHNYTKRRSYETKYQKTINN